MGILSWVVIGLLAGLLAKWIMPGKEPGGIIITILIGIAGGLVGGYLSTTFGFGGMSGFNIKSIAVATIGAIILLFVYKKLRKP